MPRWAAALYFVMGRGGWTDPTNQVSFSVTLDGESAFSLAGFLGDHRPPGRWLLPGRADGWLPASAEISQASAKMQDSGGMNLRDPGFHDAKDEPNLLHGRLFVVVKGHDQALPFGQIADCPRQPLPHLRAEIAKKRIVLGPVRQIDQLLFTRVLGTLGMQGAYFQALQFPQQLLIGRQLDVQLLSDLDVGRGTAKLRGQRLDCLLNGSPLASQLPRAPVEGPQAVQDRAANPELCVTAELDLFGRIKLAEGIQQADHSGAVKVFDRHMLG